MEILKIFCNEVANYELVFDLALKLKFSKINLSSRPLICTLPVRQKTNFCCSQHLDGDKCSEEKHSLTNYNFRVEVFDREMEIDGDIHEAGDSLGSQEAVTIRNTSGGPGQPR